MPRAALTLAALIFIRALTAQGLPPGVLLLSRVEKHVKDELQRLASISCIETIQREQQSGKGKLQPLDTVRLEVLTNGDREMFASPGERGFSEEPPLNYAGSGMLGNGLFGVYLKNILLNGNATTKYHGEEDLDGRRVARYDYQLDPAFSGQTIELTEGSGAVGLQGSFWADPQTYDVLRLDLNADGIPPSLALAELATSIRYGRTLFADYHDVLLPQTADVRLVKRSGEISTSQVEFSHCRVFGAKSSINFTAPDPASGSSAEPATNAALDPLPADIEIKIDLRSRISVDTPVGALIDGVVAREVKDKPGLVIPAGTPVRGRLRRLERYTEPSPYFVIGIEFTEVDLQPAPQLFYADLMHIDPAPGIELTLATGNDGADTPHNNVGTPGSVTKIVRERIYVHNLPGVATFFFRGAQLDLPANLRTAWKTRALKR
jgi:hypothetical protein